MSNQVCFLCLQVIQPTTIPSTSLENNEETRKIIRISTLLELLSSPCRKKIAPQLGEDLESCEFCPVCAPVISEMEEIRDQMSLLEGKMGQKVSKVHDMLLENSPSPVEQSGCDKVMQLRTSILNRMMNAGDNNEPEQDDNIFLEDVKVELDEVNFQDENDDTFDHPISSSALDLNNEETEVVIKYEGADDNDYDDSAFCIIPHPRAPKRKRGRPPINKTKTKRGRPPKSRRETFSSRPLHTDKASRFEPIAKKQRIIIEDNTPPLEKRPVRRPKKKVAPPIVKTPSRVPPKNRRFRDPLICPYCEKDFVAEYTLNYHIARHHHVPCREAGCSAKFGSHKERNAHIQDAHRVRVPPKIQFVCEICKKDCKNGDGLRSHLRRHDESKHPKCETCGEKFLHGSTLQSHRVKEHGADPLVCDECGAIFSSQPGLRQHKWNHTGIRPHKCDQCDASFSVKRNLDLHMSTHLPHAQDPCPHCDLVFKNKERLRAHVRRIHTAGYVAPTPHKCSQCEKSFQFPVLLRAHVAQVHTGERPFTCDQCGKGFSSQNLLHVHLKRKCGKDVDTTVKKDRLPRSKRDSFEVTPSVQEEEVDG